ncbi:hypothetical protein JCM16303_003992 [Sporobolomyces ruberrimus]
MFTPPDSLDSDQGPLYLSVDAGVDKYRACILDEQLKVIWVEQVEIDRELPEYSTRNGVHTLGDRVTAPSELRLKALDLLLEKLSRNTQDAHLIHRIVAVSGAGQPGTLHYLLPSFPTLLSSLDDLWSNRISEILDSSSTFALESPASPGDSSAMTQVRQLEQHFGRVSLSSSSPTPLSSASSSLSSPPSYTSSTPYSSSHSSLNVSHPILLERGRSYFSQKTGSKPLSRYSAAQLLKVREKDDLEEENREISKGEGRVFGKSWKIVTESCLLSSVFLGSLAPVDAADACSTNLFNPVKGDWEDEILEYIMGDTIGDNDGEYGRKKGVERLRELLGTVERDGGKPLGTISTYFVKRFGFSPDTLVVPFTNTDAATFLSFPLRTTPSPDSTSSPAQRDVLISLTTCETDSLMISCPVFVPHPERHIFINPAYSNEEEEEGEGENEFVAMITSKDAGLARALAKDLYCNGSWDVFTRLTAIVPHGGTLGLDGKQFSLFFPHGEATFFQEFLRFVHGSKVSELPDRKSNPRLIIESQFLSLRIRLSHLYSSLVSLDPSDPSYEELSLVSRYDPLGFPKLSKDFLPTRIVLVGGGSINPAMCSILSTIMGTSAYLLEASGLKRSRVEGEDLGEFGTRGEEGGRELERKKTSGAALGAAYKAAWSYARCEQGGGTRMSFNDFLAGKLEAQLGGGGSSIEEAQHETIEVGVRVPSDDSDEYSRAPLDKIYASPVTGRSHHRRSSSIYTLDSSQFTHSRNSSIYSSATSLFSIPPTSSHSSSNNKINPAELVGGTRKISKVVQKMYNPEDDELCPTKEIGEDPAGLELVAIPDEHEFKYYASMMPEYVRLEKHALKGLI